MSAVVGLPEARTHDELSYLLAADTYARGRLTNPSHPMWMHFEAPHVLHQPTYMSKYQPAQGAFLAFGVRFGKHPIVGVWLSVIAMTAAIYWMLLAWLPPRWALLGVVLTALQFGVAGYWAQSYWGGAVSACGGALVFGAYRRLLRACSWKPTLALCVGVLLLAFSRPFEGLVITVATLVSLLRTFVRRGQTLECLRRSILPVTIAGVLGIALLATNNRAVTGSAFTLPYQIHTEQYGASPLFLWQTPPRTPAYRHERLREFHVEWESQAYEYQRSMAGWVTHALARPATAALDHMFGPQDGLNPGWLPGPLLLPMLLLLPLSRRRWSRYALLVVALLFLALTTATYFVPHYVALLASLWMFLVVEAVRIVRVALRRRRRLRRLVVPVLLLYSVSLAGVSAAAYGIAVRSEDHWFEQRKRIANSLASTEGEHLVLVDYEKGYSIHKEWISNTADIDSQAVVWARSMGGMRDRQLIAYYTGRTVWRLTVAPDAPPLLILSVSPPGPQNRP
ncbi:MAG: hypothetical protein WBO43_00470 [Gemmatimonadota bacterium]